MDVVTGLHACGGLSDLIVAHAVSQGAAFAVCTCCFRSNRDMRVPAAPEGSLHEPGAMYVPRDTWLGLPAGELHALLRAAELQGRPDAAREAVHTVNAVRALAAERDWAARWERSCQDARVVPPRLLVRLVEFDPKFSPRSCVVLGEPQWTCSPGGRGRQQRSNSAQTVTGNSTDHSDSTVTTARREVSDSKQ